jgi:two-component system OmpR family response regulator
MRPKKRILLVCPDEEQAELCSYLLYVRGYYVLAASDAHEALERIVSTRIDLALVTLELDGLDGNALILQLRGFAPDTPMILTSKFCGSGERSHGADGFLGKDTSPARLIELVRVMTQRKRGPRKQPRAVAVLGSEALCA